MNTNLYVITPIFNPCGFQSRIRLYTEFKHRMECAGVKLLTVEIAFGNKPFCVTTAHDPWSVQLRTNQFLWHKERAINIAKAHLEHVVPDFAYMGWFDADITFLADDWLANTTQALSHYAVMQPFGCAINLDSSGYPMWNCPGTMRAFIEERGYHQNPPMPVSYTFKGHPGLAWCCTRKAFEAWGGLYDTCIAGSADTIMGNAFKGDVEVFLPKPSPGMTASMQKWGENAFKAVQGHIGFVRGSVAHHWHGQSEKRGYEKRWSILTFHKFDPVTDLKEDPHSGLWMWAGNKPQLEEDIRLSLTSRNEDEV